MKRGDSSTGGRARKRELAARDVALDVAWLRLDQLVRPKDTRIMDLINRLSRKLRFSAGEVVYPTDKTRVSLITLKSGAVDIFLAHVPKHTFVKRAEAGFVLGEIPLCGQSMWNTRAVAAQACEVLVLDESAVRSLFVKSPELALRLAEALGLSKTDWAQKYIRAKHESVESKLASFLLTAADEHGVINGLTEENVAARLGVYRETISKIVRRMRRQQLIEWERGKVTVLDPDALCELVMFP